MRKKYSKRSVTLASQNEREVDDEVDDEGT
jgi:hypothetical protein